MKQCPPYQNLLQQFHRWEMIFAGNRNKNTEQFCCLEKIRCIRPKQKSIYILHTGYRYDLQTMIVFVFAFVVIMQQTVMAIIIILGALLFVRSCALFVRRARATAADILPYYYPLRVHAIAPVLTQKSCPLPCLSRIGINILKSGQEGDIYGS